MPTLSPIERIKIINQIRKWGHHFDGKDPLSFLERTEELRASYDLEEDHLLLGLPELLRGDALLWYKNNHETWGSWASFCEQFRGYYLPPGYLKRLKREISGRSQRTGESFRAYSGAVLTMMRRAGGYSEREQLEQVYENMDPDYQLYVQLTDQMSMSELHARVAKIEEVNRRRQENQPGTTPAAKSTVATVTYNREECCWRCKQRGHTRLDCKRPPKKFCSRCGKDGVLTRECLPPTGNGGRAGDVAAIAQPSRE